MFNFNPSVAEGRLNAPLFNFIKIVLSLCAQHLTGVATVVIDQKPYIEDLIDYCIMQNWYDTSKESEAAKWTKSDKAIACLRASLSPAIRTVYKYSLSRTQAAQAPAVR